MNARESRNELERQQREVDFGFRRRPTTQTFADISAPTLLVWLVIR